MRTISVLVSLSILLFFGPNIASGQSSPGIFVDDFETYEVGSYPSAGGWELYCCYVAQVSADTSVSGTRSMKFTSSQGLGDFSVHSFQAAPGISTISVEAWVNPTRSDTNNAVLGLGRDKTAVGGVLFNPNGTIGAQCCAQRKSGFPSVGTYAANVWTHIQVVYDLSTLTFSVAVNGAITGTGFPFSGPPLNQVFMGSDNNIEGNQEVGSVGGTAVYFDAVRVGTKGAGHTLFAYIASTQNNTISIIDTTTNTVVSSLIAGNNLLGVAVSPDGTRVYAGSAYANGFGTPGRLWAFDAITNSLVASLALGDGPPGVAVNPTGTRVYVAFPGSQACPTCNLLYVLDGATLTVLASLSTGGSPLGVVVHPSGNFVYAANYQLYDGVSYLPGHSVAVIDTKTNSLITTIPVGNTPYGIAVHPWGGYLYVANTEYRAGLPPTISIIKTDVNEVISTLAVDGTPMGVAVHPNGSRFYVTTLGPNTVQAFNALPPFELIATIPAGNGPAGISLTPDGKRVYVLNGGDNTVSVVDTESNTVSATIPVPSGVGSFGQFIMPAAPPYAFDAFLHGSGGTGNPPVLSLDSLAPTATTVKYKDSASVKFSGGNPWTPIGTWTAQPSLTAGIVTTLSDLQVWLGLKNSDDQGTQFDLRAEVYRNGNTVASGETRCITSITRNPNLAKEVAVAFDAFSPVDFNGTTDVLSLNILTRIGTNPDGTKCAGPGGSHASAVGLRLYFDAVSRPSGLGAVAP